MKTPLLPAVLVAASLLGACGVGGESTESGVRDMRWVGTWGAALHQPAAVAADTTLRMIVRPTLAGERIRVRFANPYGDAPVTVGSIHAALRTTGASIDPATDRIVTFGGDESLTLAPKSEVVSDPVDLPVAIGDDLAVSFYVADPSTLSQHGASRALSYLATGDHAADADGAAFTSTATSWWGVIGVDVFREDALGTFVAFGDSITDGNDPPDINNRWPDYFATRLQEASLPVGVLNAGIGANQVTQDTNFLGTSESAVKRFERDALQRPRVRWLVLFEGTNDLGQGISADAIFSALAQLAGRAHAQGIHVIIGTITPRGKDATWTANPALEEQRVALNDKLRASVGSVFDQLADFDVALRVPEAPSIMAPEYDSGDGLHPNPLGLQVIADTVPIDALR